MKESSYDKEWNDRGMTGKFNNFRLTYKQQHTFEEVKVKVSIFIRQVKNNIK